VEAPGQTAGRFTGLERPVEPPVSTASGAQLERFAPPPAPGIALAERVAGERPFTRCRACGMDHNVSVLECSSCGERLDTDAQRAFNDELWAKRQEEAAREEAAAEERRRAQAEEAAEGTDAGRAFGEALAREIGDRERARLDAEGFGASGGMMFGPLGARILYLIPNPLLRGAAALAALLVPVTLVVTALARPGPRSVPCLLGSAVIAAIFFSRPRRRP
jgi:uncharacterized membrane protein